MQIGFRSAEAAFEILDIPARHSRLRKQDSRGDIPSRRIESARCRCLNPPGDIGQLYGLTRPSKIPLR